MAIIWIVYATLSFKWLSFDFNNLANSIVELSEKYDLREKMGKAGIKRAKQFSVENYYKNFLKEWRMGMYWNNYGEAL